jgi:hypothetical protein
MSALSIGESGLCFKDGWIGDFLDRMNPPSLRSYGGQAEFTGFILGRGDSEETVKSEGVCGQAVPATAH